MKTFVSYVILLLASSCTHHGSKHQTIADGSEIELSSLLNEEESRINECLQKALGSTNLLLARSECLKGTGYESLTSRIPSSDPELIERNRWFFDSKAKLARFYNTTKVFLKAHNQMVNKAVEKVLNNRGIGVEGSAYFGYGEGWLAEFVAHDGNFGLFCAPTRSIKTDAGVDASISVLKSLSCKTNQDYVGGFLSVSAGLSGELIGAPVGLNLAYSFGINLKNFMDAVKDAKTKGLIKPLELGRELAVIKNMQIRNELNERNRAIAGMLSFGLKTANIVGLDSKNRPILKGTGNIVRNAIKNHKSIAKQFKEDYIKPDMQRFLIDNQLHHSKAFLDIFYRTLTGCDSIGGSGSIGLSVSPVSLGLSYANYHLLLDIPIEDLRVFRAVTPLVLLNPFLLSAVELKKIVKVSKRVLKIPSEVKNKCSRQD